MLDVNVKRCRWGLGERSFDLCAKGRPVGLDGKNIVGALGPDCVGDSRIGGDGVDRAVVYWTGMDYWTLSSPHV